MKRFLVPRQLHGGGCGDGDDGVAAAAAAAAAAPPKRAKQQQQQQQQQQHVKQRQRQQQPDRRSQPPPLSRALAPPPLSLRPGGWTDLGGGALVGYWPRHFSAAASARVLRALLANVAWQQRSVVLFGRQLPQPRLVAYMSDDAAAGGSYTYSGLTLAAAPWLPELREVRDAVERLCATPPSPLPHSHHQQQQQQQQQQHQGSAAATTTTTTDGASTAPHHHRRPPYFTSALLNHYRDGRDRLGWHADDEPVYGRDPVIASASFGAARDFALRRADDHRVKLSVPLGAGDVLVMAGATQRLWQHCVPERRGVLGARVNVTFRRVVAGSN